MGRQEKEGGKIIQYNKANIVQTEKQLKNYIGIEGNIAQLMRMLSASAPFYFSLHPKHAQCMGKIFQQGLIFNIWNSC